MEMLLKEEDEEKKGRRDPAETQATITRLSHNWGDYHGRGPRFEKTKWNSCLVPDRKGFSRHRERLGREDTNKTKRERTSFVRARNTMNARAGARTHGE